MLYNVLIHCNFDYNLHLSKKMCFTSLFVNNDQLCVPVDASLFLADYKFSHGSVYETIAFTHFRTDTLMNINE